MPKNRRADPDDLSGADIPSNTPDVFMQMAEEGSLDKPRRSEPEEVEEDDYEEPEDEADDEDEDDEDSYVSEDDENSDDDAEPEPERRKPSKEARSKGLIAEVQAERKKRQDLEASLNDPSFLLAQSRKLGLSVDESGETPTVQLSPEQIQDYKIDYKIGMRDALKDFPELGTDRDFGAMATSFLKKHPGDDAGLMPLEAAQRARDIIDRQAKKARIEGKQARASQVNEKERASTVRTRSEGPTPKATQTKDLQRRLKSTDPKVSSKAYEEYIFNQL